MWLAASLFVTALLSTQGECVKSSPFLPQAVALGTNPSASGTQPASYFDLTASKNVATLDYGLEVAGYPYFIVTSLNKPTQIELKFSEAFAGLNQPLGDGPFDYAVQLANTYRVETFNVTEPGRYESTLIQGGQRWQLMTALTSAKVTIGEAGIVPTIDDLDFDTIPSTFNCSNPTYNAIWQLGARAVTAACVSAGSQTSTWQLSDQGAYIIGQKAAPSSLGFHYEQYRLIFETKIDRAGTGWTFLASQHNGINFLLISELPENTTFANINKTLTPPNTVVVTYGPGFVNQTTLPSYPLANFAVPFTVKEDTWYTVETSMSSTGYLALSVAGQQVFNVSIATYSWISGLPSATTAGSFGFGPWQDQAAYFRNVSVLSSNSTQLYHNSLETADTLTEYGVAPNTASVCLDGAKRDRLVWLGDFYHTSRIIPFSTGRSDYANGTLGYVLSWQNAVGLLNIDAPLGYPANAANEQTIGAYIPLQDYQILGLLAYYNYFLYTGDLTFIQSSWPAMKKQIAYLANTIDATTGLTSIGGFIGPAYGTATSAALAQALNGAAEIATALNDTTALTYSADAATLITGINTHLWNAQTGTYALSNSSLSNFSVTGISFAITSGAANSTQAASSIAALASLKLSPGYKDSSTVSSTDTSANISPNTNGFLLSAALEAGATAPVKYLLNNLWTAMVNRKKFSTGASWEYMSQDLTPGLGYFTSLSHPWGGAPTYVLPEYVVGVQPASPGYETWRVAPMYRGLGLTEASAKVTTKYGVLQVEWTLVGKKLTVVVVAPAGTSGSVQLPGREVLGSVHVNERVQLVRGEVALGSGRYTLVFDV